MRLRNIPGAKDAIEDSRYVIHDIQEKKGRWSEVFGNDHPVHIEVGMGKGRFIMTLAELYPEANLLELKCMTVFCCERFRKRGAGKRGKVLKNLFFIRMDARELPLILKKKGEVKKIYLNFSDPWPKERHAKRRLTSRQFLERYQQVLAKKGVVEFKTDNRELFEFPLKK